MLSEIKKNVERSLREFARRARRRYRLAEVSPFLDRQIADFIGRPGKRIRPVLFVLSYLGHSRRPRPGIYRSAVGLELLHDFLLIHDDIIDRSRMRKGKPCMHVLLERSLPDRSRRKFGGADLALVAGDILYAMAVDAFLDAGEPAGRILAGLRTLLGTTIKTGAGEFVELLAGTRPLARIRRQEVETIYDLKTGWYTFCSPLAAGALLAGAPRREIRRLTAFGLETGRAFQIKDDILDMFGTEKEIGKSALTDIKEGKKTLLVWQAYRNASVADKRRIDRILGAPRVQPAERERVRRLVVDSGSLQHARGRIALAIRSAERIGRRLDMRQPYKNLLCSYPAGILAV